MSIRRERSDAVEHRKLILQTAAQLFHQYGVQPVSMHQIAKTAGIGQATLYRRYAHKGDLCLDMLQDFGKTLLADLETYLEDNRDLPPVERLSGIINHWIDAMEEQSELILEMESKMSCNDKNGNFFLSPIYRYFRSKISAIVSEIATAKPTPLVDCDFAAHLIICSMSPIGYFHLKQEKNLTVDEMKQQYRRLNLLCLS
ncbi:TetR/AcrR family transcriptional regulator [Cohnella soli]|uniref:TetR/AcrR family transcriptional regulator n=1 Tax=Cohnella soli TaxID=425005 RepID=A0ABW0I3J4_9BACL